MSKSDMYIGDRQVSFYEKRHQRQVNPKIVMSPMVDDQAKPLAQALGIELDSHADNLQLN